MLPIETNKQSNAQMAELQKAIEWECVTTAEPVSLIKRNWL